MPNIWFISDTHFGHENIIKYCKRPFSNSREMDEFMIEQWNTTVKPEDHVYHLGDVYMGDKKAGARCVARLQGKKRLVVGNHDDLKSPNLLNAFQKVMLWRNFRDEGFTAAHVPLSEDSLVYGVQVHGHIHANTLDNPRYINVCVEHTNYKPVHMDEIIERARKWHDQNGGLKYRSERANAG